MSENNIGRATVEPLSAEAAVTFRLVYCDADGLDPGERDLLALAYGWGCDFFLCSCDKAVVVAAHTLGWLDRVASLEALADAVGARPNPPFRIQFTEARMGQWRTSLLLGGPI